MTAIEEQNPSINFRTKELRKGLFSYLGSAIRLSHKKLTSRGNSDKAKQSWGRLMVSAIGCYGGLLKDTILDDLQERVERLEKLEKSVIVKE